MTQTLHPFTSFTSGLGYNVLSSAILRIAVVSNDTGTYNLLVIFHSNVDKVYRYIFEDDGAAMRFINLLEDRVARAETSWGYEFNRALKNGDIEIV
jgi:hypothetical protein